MGEQIALTGLIMAVTFLVLIMGIQAMSEPHTVKDWVKYVTVVPMILGIVAIPIGALMAIWL